MRRVLIYVNERFPLYQTIPLAGLFGGVISLCIPTLLKQPVSASVLVFACAALFLFLLRLRLMDDIKDHAHDSVHHSHRPAARGVVTQYEITFSLALVLLCEIVVAAQVGFWALVTFCVAALYSGFLFWEALSGDRLRKNFGLYIAIHEILLFPLFVYLFILSGASISDVWTVPVGLFLLFLSALFFLIEVARKVHAPNDEGGGRDTYSFHYGARGATMLLLGNATMAVAAFVILSIVSGASHKFGLIVTLSLSFLCGLSIAGYRYISHPTSKTALTFFMISAIFVAAMLVLASLAITYEI